MQMRSLHANVSDKRVDSRAERRVHELIDGVGKVALRVKGGRRDIHIDHQLLVSRSDGAVEPLPCLQTTAERTYLLGKEKAIPAHHYAILRWVLSKYNIESRQDRPWIVVPIVAFAS